MLSVAFYCYAECCYAECHIFYCYAECRYAECYYDEYCHAEFRYAECRGPVQRKLVCFSLSLKFLLARLEPTRLEPIFFTSSLA
jgi:hypothetical protein